MFYLSTLNFYLALASLGLTVATVALYIDYFVFKGKYFADKIKEISFLVVIAVTVFSLAMSLVYSEYFGFIPCSLCWLQRIAIYPQALLAVLAFKMNDKSNFPIYGIGLSLFGLFVSIYHYIYQMIPKETGNSIMPCLVDGSNADCAVKVINEFGFVTFPFVSAVTFAFLIVMYLYIYRSGKIM